MSETLESVQMQDLVDAISAYIEELPDNQHKIDTSLNGVQTFLETIDVDKPEGTDVKPDLVLYPFRDNTQPVYRKDKLVMDRTLSRVYPVVTDLINSTYLVGSQENTLGRGLERKLESLKQQHVSPISNPNIPVQQQQIYQEKPSFFERMVSAVSGKKTVERIVENPWETSHNMILEAMNIPNVWKKMVKAHATGRLRAYYFQSGMDFWRRGEIWYLEAHVEPEIMKMIDASDNITRGYELRNIALILTKYYEQAERRAGMLGMMPPTPPSVIPRD